MDQFLTVESAAAYRGVTPRTIRNWTRAGRLTQHQGKRGAMISRSELQEVTRADALEVATRHGSMDTLAAEVRDLLWPVSRAEVRVAGGMIDFEDRRSTSGTVAAQQLADYRNGALVADATTVFGTAVLHAACAPLKVGGGGGCRWCLADVLSVAMGAPPPVDLPAWQTLLGPKCLGCVLNLTAPKPQKTAARTASGAARPSTAARTAGPTPKVWWSSQATNARALAAQARRRGEQGEASQLEQRATVYETRARRGDPIG